MPELVCAELVARVRDVPRLQGPHLKDRHQHHTCCGSLEATEKFGALRLYISVPNGTRADVEGVGALIGRAEQRVSLPEGHMRRAVLGRLERRGEAGNFALLRAVGDNMIGLVRAADAQSVAPRTNDELRLNGVQALQMEEGSLLKCRMTTRALWSSGSTLTPTASNLGL